MSLGETFSNMCEDLYRNRNKCVCSTCDQTTNCQHHRQCNYDNCIACQSPLAVCVYDQPARETVWDHVREHKRRNS